MDIVTLKNFSFFYDDDHVSLIDISVQMVAGTTLFLFGPSGSGKTTLLRAIAGELQPAGGDCTVRGKSIFVPQRPEERLLAYATPRAFLQACCAQAGGRRLGECLGYFHLGAIADRPMAALSGGQIQLTAAAGAMAAGAELLILDEPTAQLDPIAASEFLGLLHRLCRELGISVILAEHRADELFSMADQVLILDNGRVIADRSPREAIRQICAAHREAVELLPAPARVWERHPVGDCALTISEGRAILGTLPKPIPKPAAPPEAHESVLTLKNAWFRYEKNGADILKDLSLVLGRGEILCVMGGNGTGKSTLLHVLEGRLRIYSGRRSGASPLLVPQDPRPLFEGKPVGSILRADSFGADLLPKGLWGRDADHLSCGEVQRAAMVWALQQDADIVLMDEPTRGMDAVSRKKLTARLREAAQGGKTFLIVSHDVEFCAAAAHRCALLFGGQIIAQGPPSEFCRGNLAYTTSAARMSGCCTTTEELLEQL